MFVYSIRSCLFLSCTLAIDVHSTQACNLLLIFNETIDCWTANLALHRGGGGGGLLVGWLSELTAGNDLPVNTKWICLTLHVPFTGHGPLCREQGFITQIAVTP